ncbi:MAG: hypothetical protein JRJ59_12435 [Deltaproteobacteria bacterium]|nr:hypothetical protein [Deltaproteobacteria bacterium]
MSPRAKVILLLCLLGLVDVIIPVPVVALVGVYVAITRPSWFRELVDRVYLA